MDKIKLKALGKINLGLDVLGRRPNGYHDVRMVMQTVYLYDQILLEKTDKEGISLETNLFYLPVNENNLIYKAIKMLKDEYHFQGGVEVNLNKFIPVAAGMAGGSTDAASAMFGVNRLYRLGLSTKKMMDLGVNLGADVPYCVMRGTALAEGIGEKLTKLPAVPHMWLLVAKPPINVSTRIVYESLDMNGVTEHPDIDGIIQAVKDQDVNAIAAKMGNVLENVTIPLYPVIDMIKQDMLSHGAINAMMSGSGPTVFGIFPDEQTALQCQAFLKDKGDARQVYITETFH